MRNRQAFTLIEVLVSLVILALFTALFLAGITGNMTLNRNVQANNELARVAEQYMENYRQKGNYGSMRTNTSQNITLNGQSYTISTTFCPADAPSNMPCDSESVFIRLKVLKGSVTLQTLESYYTTM